MGGSRMGGDLFVRVANFVRNGARRPLWFNAVRQNPPEPCRIKGPKPPTIKIKEDPLIDEYHRRNTTVIKRAPEVISLLEYAPKSRIQLFIERQVELLSSGMNQEEAYRRVELEFLWDEYRLELEKEVACNQAMEFGAESPVPIHERMAQLEEKEIAAGETTRRKLIESIREKQKAVMARRSARYSAAAALQMGAEDAVVAP